MGCIRRCSCSCATNTASAAKPGGGIVRNVGAGVLEGDAAAINTLFDPFGNMVGKPFRHAAMFAHDALAPVFGYERFSDADRAALLDDSVPQPGTRLVSALPGANPADVPATTPAEQLTRKAVAAGTAAGTLGSGCTGTVGGGVGGAVIGGNHRAGWRCREQDCAGMGSPSHRVGHRCRGRIRRQVASCRPFAR